MTKSIVPTYKEWTKLTKELIFSYVDSRNNSENHNGTDKEDVIKYFSSCVTELIAEMIDKSQLRITLDWKLRADPKNV